MTSRERVLAACSRRQPDRVPIDVGGTQVSGIAIDMYCALLRHLGIKELPIVYEQFEMLARVSEPIRKRLHSDVISLENPVMSWGLPNRHWKPWRTFQGNDCLMPGGFNPRADEKGELWLHGPDGAPIAHMPKGGLYFDYADATALSDAPDPMPPEQWRSHIYVYTDEDLRTLERRARALHTGTDYAVVSEFAMCKFGSMNRTIAGLSPSDWLCALLTDEAYIDDVLGVCCEQALLNARLLLEAVGDNVDVILTSSVDFGTQRAEIFSPELWRRLYMPRYRAVCDYIHAHSRAKTMIHTCGSVRNIIPHIIEAGFDVLNPVQVTAESMDAPSLKAAFGNKICFWGGGVDTQTVLPFGTPAEVEAQVRERIAQFSPGGGYVFNPTHCIQFGVPPANLLAAVDAACEAPGAAL